MRDLNSLAIVSSTNLSFLSFQMLVLFGVVVGLTRKISVFWLDRFLAYLVLKVKIGARAR